MAVHPPFKAKHQTSGLVGHGYTVTHYVAPFASVSGATSDSQNISAGSYSASTNPATPTTFGTAAARASAGHVIEMAPGSYSAAGGTGGDEPAFDISVTGSSGNLIVFTAKYPAAYNTTNRTQLRNTGTDVGGMFNSPTIRLNDYTVIDGFYFDYANGGGPSSRGCAYFGNTTTGAHMRRLRWDRADLGNADDGDNGNCIQFHTSINCTVSDCHFHNGFDDDSSHNESCITTYDGENCTIQHCWFENVSIGMYHKGTVTNGNYGVSRYNFFDRCRRPYEISANHATNTNVMEITQNLIITIDSVSNEDGMGTFGFDNSAGSTQSRYFSIHHNTIINLSDSCQPIWYETSWNGTGCVFRDNIVASFVSTSQPTVNVQGSLSNFTTWDYNRYYENGNTIQYHYSPTTHSSLANWRTASGRDANSTEGDPDFESQATGDYRLDGDSPCLTLSSTGGPLGCYITGSEEIGLRANPTY